MDGDALNQLIPLVYNELRALARRQLSREPTGDRLQTTALVNETYIKLSKQRQANWQDRGHFFAIAAHLMRRILIDYARRDLRKKRGGRGIRIALDDLGSVPSESAVDPVDILSVDRALLKLDELDPEQGWIVELRFFGGLTVEETAAVIGKSPATVKRDWSLAKGWLYRELGGRDVRT